MQAILEAGERRRGEASFGHALHDAGADFRAPEVSQGRERGESGHDDEAQSALLHVVRIPL